MIERGTVLTVSPGGGSGSKPRPAIVVQADDLDFPNTLVVVPLTSQDGDELLTRPVFLPDGTNGLREPSSLMAHRIAAIRKSDIGKSIGMLSASDMERVELAMQIVLGMARA